MQFLGGAGRRNKSQQVERQEDDAFQDAIRSGNWRLTYKATTSTSQRDTCATHTKLNENALRVEKTRINYRRPITETVATLRNHGMSRGLRHSQI